MVFGIALGSENLGTVVSPKCGGTVAVFKYLWASSIMKNGEEHGLPASALFSFQVSSKKITLRTPLLCFE